MIKVIWSSKAIEDYWQIINYFETEWTEREAVRFIKKLDEVINLLRMSPFAFPATDVKKIRMALVVPQAMLFYRAEGQQIDLVRLWSVAQDPQKLKL